MRRGPPSWSRGMNSPLAQGGAGVALLFNATPSAITSVAVTPATTGCARVPGLTLFPVAQGTGTSAMAGCSFAIPAGAEFTVTVPFEMGDQALLSATTRSRAAPALYLVAFLNGLVATQPDGAASTIGFQSRSDLQSTISGELP